MTPVDSQALPPLVKPEMAKDARWDDVAQSGFMKLPVTSMAHYLIQRERQLRQSISASRLLAREVLRLRGKEATEAQIQCVLDEFADAARRAK